ncbi:MULTISPECIES: choice-of-anchor K domain-containing protein [unclassified Nostoc]|uniref:choice-of-anchor K domain-containing protein n=1 Tax=unclassified Nostoc TaxID=2593658 RepID=UPI002AD46947|nr:MULTISPECIES: choice-of-anchor K domain-containing protein [unclassified Nostoc]MDZ8123158.1 choice-of-anchor K domain-containing protein [Nostoc sp. CmiVER01]MDZ8224547.1 choice-of-anchor K domain-containing protein [Nostoc sp. ChiVER01]
MKISLVFATAISSFFVGATVTLGFSNRADALTFSGISTGTWGEPTPGSIDINPNPIYTGVGNNIFTWGDANVCLPSPNPSGCTITGSNKLTFSGNSFSTDINSVFKIADLTYFNGTVVKGTSVEEVPLNLNVSFISPVGISQVFDLKLHLVNTFNSVTNSEEENADLVFIDENLSNPSFDFEGNKYTLELIGFNPDVEQTSIKAFEGGTTKTAIYAKIKTIPEPATVAGLFLLGMYLISNKKLLEKK